MTKASASGVGVLEAEEAGGYDDYQYGDGEEEDYACYDDDTWVQVRLQRGVM